jgi:DNA-binding GntR family transcriptional regulator
VVDPDSPELAYMQVANDLARRIQAGEIKGRLASERDLAEEYEVGLRDHPQGYGSSA